jgi:ABC-type glycerol-3-phosphate transport system substrate-binding protein
LLVAHAGPLFRADPPESDPLGLSPGFALAIERVRELRPWMHPAFDINDQHAAWQQFRGGRAAFIVSSPALIRELAAAGFPHRVLPPPTGEYGRPITTGALGCFAVVDHPDDPERTRAAQLFAKYLTSAEVARDVPGWYLAAPVRQSEASFYADPAYAPLKPIARDAIYMNAPGGGGFLEEAVIPAVQSALLGEMTAEEAKAKMRAALARRMVKK